MQDNVFLSLQFCQQHLAAQPRAIAKADRER
jgi:hypothetical protein